MRIEFEIFCHKCGAELNIVAQGMQPNRDVATFDVEPCKDCLEEREKEIREELES